MSEASWRYTLLINVPIGLIIVALTPARFPGWPRTRSGWIRAAHCCPAAGLGALVYGLSRAGVAGWASPSTLAPLTVAALVLPAFVAWESRTSSPIMPLWAWKNQRGPADTGGCCSTPPPCSPCSTS